MATRSRVGIVNADSTITSAYVHYDGYPSGVGSMLKGDYGSEEQIRVLINGGDMSSLGEGYYSTRGEKCPPRVSKGVKEFFASCRSGEEYAYIWDGEWVAYCLHGKKPTMVDIP